MTEYRFKLQKYKRGTKLTCPKCGRKQCFVKYIDTEGEIVFPDYVGRCDHECSCQYHYTPSDYFKDNPELYKDKIHLFEHTEEKVEPHIVPTSYVDKDIMERSLSNYNINPLYMFLSDIFGKDETSRIFELYNVGTSKKWGGSTVFWQVDREDKIRTGKIMLYNSKTGHRVKEPRSYISWAHTEMHLKDFNMVQCLFGEHILEKYPTKSVAMVESEKSAIIATHYMPDFIWLATGGMHGCFNSDVISILRNRDVILCPDLGATEVWREKMPLLSSICSKVILSEQLEQCATEEQKKAGLDIADFLLMCDSPEMILRNMTERNPAIKKLIKLFNLHLVDTDD